MPRSTSQQFSDAERNEARALLVAREAREAKRQGILAELFDRQRAVADEWMAGVRFLALCCSRRAGKTQLLARLIAISLLMSGRNEWTVFCAATFGVAKNIVWDELVAINKRHELGWKCVETDGTIQTATGARFRLVGVDDKKQIEKIRGLKYRLVVLDEASTYQEILKRLYNDVIRPGLVDLNGSLILSGTPGYVCAGYWFKAAHKELHYKVHGWTLAQNPHIKNVDAELAAIRDENKWTEEEPTYRREYLGLWINDGDSLVFGGYDPERNRKALEDSPMPEFYAPEWIVTVGLDYGTEKDPSAIVVLGTPKGSDVTYALFAKKYPKLLPDELSAELREVVKRFKPDRAVGDSGGLGKPYVEEWNRRHSEAAGITVHPAAKQEKLASTQLCNGAFRSLKFLVTDEARELEDEMLYLPWFDSNRTKSHPAYADHACFVAGTMVETSSGPVAIEKVRVGDMVWTRSGLKRVRESAATGIRSVWSLTTADGRLLEGTPDHPILTEDGWVRLDSLRYGHKLLTWGNPLQATCSTASSTASDTAATPSRRNAATVCTGSVACQVGSVTSTVMCGSASTGQSHQSTTSTTSTTTRSTTTRATWNACRQASTLGITRFQTSEWPCPGPTSTNTGTLPRNGIGLTLGARGTQHTASCHGLAGSNSLECANSAAAVLTRTCPDASAQTSASRLAGEHLEPMTLSGHASSAAQCFAPTSTTTTSVAGDRVAVVGDTGKAALVFNLSVEDCPEFFANGVLVHNCDAGRYAFKDHVGYAWVTKPEAPFEPHEKWSTVEVRKERTRKKQQGEGTDWWET